MTRSTERRILELITNPPEGSPIAQAKAFGVDLFSLFENLKLTPAQRCLRAEQNRLFAEQLRKAGSEAGL